MARAEKEGTLGVIALGALGGFLVIAPVPAGAGDNSADSYTETATAKKKMLGAEAKGAASGSTEKAGKKSYYVPTRGYRLEPQPDVPPYVRELGKTYKQFEGIDWLDVGLDSRVRFEYRTNDYRPWTDTSGNLPILQRRNFPNSLWLERTRAYLGVKNILDPLRFVVEFQDSRAFNSIYELQGQEINQSELISAYGELYFKDAFGKDDRGNDRPLILRAGRFHLELLDRRLIAENEFRNTTNNFEGFRIKVGKRDNDWDLDSFLMRPVVRYPYWFDRPDWQNWIYGSVLSIRRWSEYATVQPYFIGRKQYGDPLNVSSGLKVHRDTYAPGLRVYGVLGNFDYDFDINKQMGEVGEFRDLGTRRNAIQTTLQHDAIGYGFEAGYTFSDHPWKPRVSAVYVYGTGNKSPYDSVNQNFDPFYGFNQPFSRNDYLGWNNAKNVKARLEFEPAKNTQIDTAFSAYWLASTAAAWDRANLYAPLGNRGDFMGTEYDIRIRHKLNQFINLTASYARFWPGSFTSSFAPPTSLQWPPVAWPGQSALGQTGSTNGLTARPTDFFYLEVSANGFGDGQPIAKPPGSDFFASMAPDAPPAPRPSWTDVYVGLNGGGAWSSPASNVQVVGVGPAPASLPVAFSAAPIDTGNHLAGFIGGLQLGANWNFSGNFLAGVETDLHGVSGNTDTKWQLTSANGGGDTFLTYEQRTATLNYLGTVRGRLGYLATPTLVVYGTGGMAYGGVVSNTAIFTRRVGGTSQTQVNPVFQDTLVGWSAGGGVEWMFLPNWSAKVDYLHYDLGNARASGFAAPSSGAFNYNASTSTRFNGDLVQAGVNRHFDLFAAEPAVARN
ncbi:alginate export family protein [Methylocystis sp. WRRC1]|uniref:alginate export family protein n=1 Tax=Methylocystis sp. WRRC1 TaxID=1732014 RepID=UPI001D145C71|nr:alginate export family protein [Methylocystis sp. WRRC1]MCC3244429.1 alginate export family protein [Methylocystis sp. WRRC1]